MRIVSIIAEYNPLHNGHVRHLAQAKGQGDLCLVMLSGGFCQRGFSMVMDKYTRARHAIFAGADIVVELPTVYAVNCAEWFAKGAVRLLESIPSVQTLSFGSECGDIDAIYRTASLLHCPAVEEQCQALVREGMAYPKARAQALQQEAQRTGTTIVDIAAPNNILALEYVQASHRLALHTIPRTSAYDGSQGGESASYVRKAMARHSTELCNLVPPYVQEDFSRATPEQDVLYLAALRAQSKQDLAELWDASEGLQNRLWQCAQQANSIQEALALCATKRYTQARIARLVTAALLDITTDLVRSAPEQAPYYNVLAVRKEHCELLSLLAQHGQVITTQQQLQGGTPLQQLDAHAHETYRLLHGIAVPNSMQIV